MIRPLLGSSRTHERPLIGPEDHGRLMVLDEFENATETPGYVYELIDGVLIVSPTPNPAHDHWVELVRHALQKYADEHPERINKLTERFEVVIPGRPGVTRSQPDLGAFRDFPDPPPPDWDDVCPVIVVEVISRRREKKDTTRNHYLYWMAGGISEYWIIDPTKDPTAPALIALARKPGEPDWVERVVPFGKSYRSTALPRFSLNLKRPKRK